MGVKWVGKCLAMKCTLPGVLQGYTHIPRHYQERSGAHQPKVVMHYPHAVEPDRGDLSGGAPDTMNHTGALEIVDCMASCETGICGARGAVGPCTDDVVCHR